MDEKDLRIQDLKIENDKLKEAVDSYKRKCENFSLMMHDILNDKKALEAELQEAEDEQGRLEELYVKTLIERDKAENHARYLASIDDERMEREW